MKHFLLPILPVFLICLHGCTGQRSDNLRAAPSGPGAAMVPGEQIFVQRCAACHGKDGTAGIANAANLQTSRLDVPAIKQTIASGRGAMPPFGKMLSTVDIAQVAEYVHGLKKQDPANNAPGK